jgi:hypothetical protein
MGPRAQGVKFVQKFFRIFQQIVKLIFHKITLKRGIFNYHSGTIEAGVDIGFAGI